jgi:Sec-independent protein secretion pathway component TatC
LSSYLAYVMNIVLANNLTFELMLVSNFLLIIMKNLTLPQESSTSNYAFFGTIIICLCTTFLVDGMSNSIPLIGLLVLISFGVSCTEIVNKLLF